MLRFRPVSLLLHKIRVYVNQYYVTYFHSTFHSKLKKMVTVYPISQKKVHFRIWQCGTAVDGRRQRRPRRPKGAAVSSPVFPTVAEFGQSGRIRLCLGREIFIFTATFFTAKVAEFESNPKISQIFSFFKIFEENFHIFLLFEKFFTSFWSNFNFCIAFL